MKKDKIKHSDVLFESEEIKSEIGEKIKISQFENGISKQEYEIENKEQEQLFQKNIGKYVLLDIKDLLFFDKKIQKYFCNIIKKELIKIIKKSYKKTPQNVLVVGIGNKNLLADCLGDKVVERILTTRHLIKQKILQKDFCSVSCFSCSVFGKTGIETADVVKKLCEIVSPNLVVCVDTFVSSSLNRLGKSVQISSCGITPGGGVNNSRKGIDEDFLKVPVVTIGVPLLVDLNTICRKNIYGKYENLVVMDKEIEKYVKYYAEIISNAINLSLNQNLSIKDIDDLRY